MDEIWTCPFCHTPGKLDENCIQKDTSELHVENSEGLRELVSIWIVCPYEDCKRISLSCYLYEIIIDASETGFPKRDRLIKKWSLIPDY